jgi:hypothetical protein
MTGSQVPAVTVGNAFFAFSKKLVEAFFSLHSFGSFRGGFGGRTAKATDGRGRFDDESL